VVLLVLSLGPELTVRGRGTGIPGPYALLAHLPLFDTLLPTRLGQAATWALAPIAALAVAAAHLPSRVLTAGLVAAVLVPLAPTPTLVFDRPPAPAFITSGAWRAYVDDDDSVLVVPLADFEHWTAQSWSTATGLDLRLSHGYFLAPEGGVTGRRAVVGPPPRFLDGLIRTPPADVSDADRDRARADLRYWHTALILVPPEAGLQPQRALFDALFGPGRLTGGVWVWDVR
jgi:hypothetical protein